MSLFQTLLLNQSDPIDHFQAFLNRNLKSLDYESNIQMDWKETRDSHIFEFDLPGFTKEDVKIELHENRVLCIKAEKKTEQEEENEEMSLKWHCRERRNNGLLLREFRLPENSKVDDVKASMNDGVLTIVVAKDATKKKNNHQHKKKVKIYEEGSDDDGVSHKGIGRFVCCKA
ncbi:hypothetical protein TSUD_272960 [Trifolium subterraneum]|uniref:SHSP domain-containing protein n=1 Tax=Trifolium subterraneum TaxID=3900 RepID=A0A2Z6P4N6_TRISU|nr:hypothetical protein TSUD_272960 [Trifolium subterraneum]